MRVGTKFRKFSSSEEILNHREFFIFFNLIISSETKKNRQKKEEKKYEKYKNIAKYDEIGSDHRSRIMDCSFLKS